MISKIKFGIATVLERFRKKYLDLKFKNVFHVEHWRGDTLLNSFEFENGVTVAGINHLLDVGFGGGTQKTTWYIGLIDNSPTPSLSENDTLASHSGWSEFTSYSGDRKEWTDAASASKIKSSSATSDFTMTGSGTLYGMFLAAAATGTSEILFNTAAFPSTQAVASSDVFKVSFSIRLQ